MKTRSTSTEREAAAWLLFAYSLNHAPDCVCERCAEARKLLDKRKTAAA